MSSSTYFLESTYCLLVYTREKRSAPKGKNLLPKSKFFPFRVDPFSEEEAKRILTKMVG